MSRDRPKKAVKVLQNIAKFNKRQLPENIAMELLSEGDRKLSKEKEEEKGVKKRYTVVDLFRGRFIAKITLLMIVDWYVLKNCFMISVLHYSQFLCFQFLRRRYN